MPRWSLHDIRTLILLAILAAMAPAVALMAGSNYWHRGVIQQQVRATTEQAAERARAEHRSRAMEELFAVLAASDEIRSLDPGRCRQYLARLDAASTRYLQVRIFATNGARLCGDGQQKGVKSVAAEWWFRQAMETGAGVYVGDLPDPATGEAMSVFARALADARRKPRAVIEIGVRTDVGAAPSEVVAASTPAFDGSIALQLAALVVCAVLAVAIGWMGAGRVATLLRDRQRATREAELSVRAIADQPLAGVCVLDADGVVFANDALAHTLGTEPAHLAAQRDLLDLQGRLAALATGRAEAVPHDDSGYEHRARRADGTAVQLRVSAHRIEHNGRPALLAVAVEARKPGVTLDGPVNDQLMLIAGHADRLAEQLPAESETHHHAQQIQAAIARLAAMRAPAVDAESEGPATILLVEDEQQVRELLTETLQQVGYQVLPAANGDEAIGISGTHRGPIAALLSDVMMPGLNGPAVAARLVPERPEMKVVFMSGYPAREVLAERSHEHSAFLSKPFSRAQLTATLNAVLVEAYAGQP